jgi:hypothetical protein
MSLRGLQLNPTKAAGHSSGVMQSGGSFRGIDNKESIQLSL